MLSETLLASDALRDIQTAKLILDIVECYSKAREKVGEEFFFALINSQVDGIQQSLEKVLAIVQNGLGEIFFECASTPKIQYYSADILVEMVDLFHQIIPHLPKPLPAFNHLAPYDHGGKEFLLGIVKNPKDLTSLFPTSSRLSLRDLVQIHSFDQMKSGAIQYLSSLNEKNRLPMETYLKLFKSLQNGLKCKKLNSLEKKGIVVLLIVTTTNEKKPIVNRYNVEDLQDLVNESLEIHEYCGEEVLIYFCSAPDLQNGVFLDEVIRALQRIRSLYQNFTKFYWFQKFSNINEITDLLIEFSKNKIPFTEFLKTLDANAPRVRLTEVEDRVRVDTLFRRFTGNAEDPNVVFPLSADILKKVRQQYETVHRYCKEWEPLCIGELVNLAVTISSKANKDEDDILRLVAIGRLAIRIEFQMVLYNTQVCTVLAQLSDPNGVVAQVKTGEGKSKEVTLLAFVLAMKSPSQGHIISSSRSLSVRDQKEHANFFRIFRIKTSHICEDDRDARYFQARILYGTATDFEFAVMREMLFFKKLFPIQPNVNGEKRFDWVIVDEIDNLTIDTALSGARLSSNAEITFDWVYVPVFEFVKTNFTSEDLSAASSSAMLGKLRAYLKEYREGKFARVIDGFSDKKLSGWIKSACTALFKYEEKRDYVIGLRDSMRGKTSGILIVDAENTGRILHGSRWNGGVHEFIEVKHGLDVERENVCPISMSHPVFYQMYRSVFGITGTIGSRFEREELKTIYQIDSFDAPTHNPSRRQDNPPTVLKTDAQYVQFVFAVIQRCIRAKRPILVLCPSIKDTEVFAKRLKEENVPFEMLNEIQKRTEQEVIEKAGLPGAVTIATNTAGRGTDIKLSEESLVNGGLHVLITFYPESDRVELQARGRAGRQGQPGSSEIVLSRQKLNQDEDFAALEDDRVVSYLHQQRQRKAIRQKDLHVSYAVAERTAFQMVTEFYRMLNIFHESAVTDVFLNRLADFLNRKKCVKLEKRDFDNLGSKNRKIAEIVLKLLNDPQDASIQWKALVQQLIQRVQDHVINDFALNFHDLASEMIQDSGVTSDLEAANRLKEISEKSADDSVLLENLLRAVSAIKLEAIQSEIKAIFEKRKPVWESYLDPSGCGILKYLSDMTKIDFSPVETDKLVPAWAKGERVSATLIFDKDFDGETTRLTPSLGTEEMSKWADSFLKGISLYSSAKAEGSAGLR